MKISVPYQYDKRNITSASYPLHKRRKQAIALLPILSEKQGATYVFSLKHGSDGRIVYDNIQSKYVNISCSLILLILFMIVTRNP